MNFRQQLLLVAMLTLPCVHSTPPIAVKTKLKRDVSMSHCAYIDTVYADNYFETRPYAFQITANLKLGLHETTCTILNGSSNSFLYTVGLSAVEQHYPVTQHYQFAVPLITMECICDCSRDKKKCNLEEYNSEKCKSTQSSLCHRSYHPDHGSAGCSLGESSALCCNTSFTPYKDWRFRALKIEEPQTVANFTYRAYIWSRGDWKIVEENEIRTQLDGSKRMVELSKNTETDIEVSVTAHPHKLEPGMYFMRDGEDKLRFGVNVNPLDGSRPDELGWFRLGNDGKYKVQNENLEMNNLHSMTVLNCKDQKFNSSFNKIGHYVMSGVDGDRENFNLGSIVSYSKPWIDRSLLKPETENETRTVVVIFRELNRIEVAVLAKKNGENLLLVYNTSVLTSFTGSIRLDNTSNRFLVLNFTDSVGTVRGSCYVNESKKTNELSFRVYVSSNNLSDASTIVRLPSSINSSRYICLETDNSNQGETCKWLDYNSEPLTYNLSNIFWQEDTGHSTGCNKFTTFCDDPVKNLPSNLLIKVGLLVIVFVAVISIITMIAVISVKKKKFFYGVIPSTSP